MTHPRVLSSSSRRLSLGKGLDSVLAVIMQIVVIFIVTPPPVSRCRHLSSRDRLLGLGMDGVRSRRCSMSLFLFNVVESRRHDLAVIRRGKKWTASLGEGLDGVVVVRCRHRHRRRSTSSLFDIVVVQQCVVVVVIVLSSKFVVVVQRRHRRLTSLSLFDVVVITSSLLSTS